MNTARQENNTQQVPHEHQLLREFGGGEERAFTALYRRYFERVLFFARRYVGEMDAQDITAEAFLQLWKKRAGFADTAAIVQFLFVTARNRCYDQLRRQQVREQHAAELAELMESGTDDFFLDQVRIEFVKLIDAQVSLLPDKMREVFLLSFREGLKPAQIAEQLGISVKTVSNQKATAIGLLRTALRHHPLEVVLTLLVQLEHFR